ncbi:aconitase X swivel domain-containing protein [Paenarthrobacter sp. NPDC058040]|uniref:aconitase X swivel domain-containing protein n=1 Tax=unclassified Paenarthrobacter TaxID=2634190 RepID=UPI0036DAE457
MTSTTKPTHVAKASQVLVPGAGRGEVISSQQMLSFWGGLDPSTGTVIDHRHSLRGQSVAGKILVLPKGKGSSTGSAVLVDALFLGNGPAAIIMREADEIISLGVVVFEEFYQQTIPVIVLDTNDFECALSGQFAEIDMEGTVRLYDGL